MRVIFTGDSHLGALKRGWEMDSDKFGMSVFEHLGRGGLASSEFFTFDKEESSVTTVADGWKNRTFSQHRLNDDYGPNLLVVSMPLNTSRILRDYSWRKHVPWKLKRELYEVALSGSVVSAMIEQDCVQSIRFVKALASVGIETAVLEAPRFFDRAPFLIRKRMDVCLYIDTLYRQYVKAELEGSGVGVIAQPQKTMNEHGLTCSKYAHENPKDTHHGSAAYGLLALEAVRDYAKSV